MFKAYSKHKVFNCSLGCSKSVERLYGYIVPMSYVITGSKPLLNTLFLTFIEMSEFLRVEPSFSTAVQVRGILRVTSAGFLPSLIMWPTYTYSSMFSIVCPSICSAWRYFVRSTSFDTVFNYYITSSYFKLLLVSSIYCLQNEGGLGSH